MEKAVGDGLDVEGVVQGAREGDAGRSPLPVDFGDLLARGAAGEVALHGHATERHMRAAEFGADELQLGRIVVGEDEQQVVAEVGLDALRGGVGLGLADAARAGLRLSEVHVEDLDAFERGDAARGGRKFDLARGPGEAHGAGLEFKVELLDEQTAHGLRALAGVARVEDGGDAVFDRLRVSEGIRYDHSA